LPAIFQTALLDCGKAHLVHARIHACRMLQTPTTKIDMELTGQSKSSSAHSFL
jgi:hypothetical protein